MYLVEIDLLMFEILYVAFCFLGFVFFWGGYLFSIFRRISSFTDI